MDDSRFISKPHILLGFRVFFFELTIIISMNYRWRSALLWRTFFTTAVVAVVIRSLINYCHNGNCGLFGEGGLIMFDLSSTITTYSIRDLLAILVLGGIGGIFGGLYNFLLDRILRAYSIINEYDSLLLYDVL